ncbi:MAG: hypothetical protein ACLQDV_07230 [Candidatus Binataceae bacterium]
MPRNNEDDSWKQTLTYAFESRFQFGPDLAFTYGPLGFIQNDEYSPASYLWLVAIRAPVLVLLGLFYLRLLRPLPIVFSAALAATIVVAATYSREAAFVSAALLVALVLSDADTGIMDCAGLALLCGAVSLMKFSYFITIGAVYLITALYRALRWREYPLALALWALSAVAGFVVSGQHPSSLPEYLRSSFNLAAGYGEAMQLFGPPLETYRFFTLAVAFLVIFAWDGYRSQGGWSVFPLCAVTVVVMVIAKNGFVRHGGLGGHQGVAVPPLVTVVALCSAWVSRRRVNVAAAALFVVATGVFFFTVPVAQIFLADATGNAVAIGDLLAGF